MRLASLAALVLVLPAWCAAAEPSGPGYRVLKKIAVGGEGGWDYLTVDPAAHRLYISRSTRVQVVDLDTDKVVGEIANTPGVHGIAIAPAAGRGFTSNGRDGTVTVFDLKTLREIERVKVGKGPDAIIFDDGSGRVFTFNAGSKDATAIEAETGKVAGTVPLGGKPEFAAADGKGHVYVDVEDTGEVVAFDSHTLKVEHRWPLAPDKEPAGLAMDRKRGHLFPTCHSQHMVVLDTDGKVVARVPIGRGTDAAAFDPDAGLAFSSNGDGTLTVVGEKDGEYKQLQSVSTQQGARTMALDPKSHRIYLATARFKPAAPGERRRAIEPDSFVILVVGKEGKTEGRPGAVRD
jgi:DNA-binding beta-propeller fold protein YncE